ncbi:Tpr And Ankyrin Repeat-Containing Protein 1 [Manis pentadactyla]|nr:Tpr And Ankyrin Repeat-Containing Protein 1 [Manis pentadactyla]
MSSHCPTSARPHRPFQPRGKGTADKAGSAQGKGLRLGAPAERLLNGSAPAPHSPRRPPVSRRTHPRAAHNGARRLAAKCVSARARTTTPRHPHGAPRPASPGGGHLDRPVLGGWRSRGGPNEHPPRRPLAVQRGTERPRLGQGRSRGSNTCVGGAAATESCSTTTATTRWVGRKLGKEERRGERAGSAGVEGGRAGTEGRGECVGGGAPPPPSSGKREKLDGAEASVHRRRRGRKKERRWEGPARSGRRD